jgi:plastocyanin
MSLPQPLFRARVALTAAAMSLGCNHPPAPMTPSAGAQPAAAPAGSTPAAPAGPTMIGTVLLMSTGKPPPSGGVVYLQDAPKLPGAAMAATIDVHHKAFTPFIAVITTGGTVTFGNKDALTHHVFSPDIPKWDTGYLEKNGTATRTFDSPAVISLLCNIHPEMLGYLLVIPSTYYGKVGADGKYAISNVPAGSYKATAWAPRTPTVTQSVTLADTGSAVVDFELRPETATN